MNKNLKISVIVPVYKVEQYLIQCLESICNQTYKNLEIILVDDGSPDNSPKICDDYAKKDKRIIVVHKTNGGLSSARNVGLDICKGDLISFVDSDDWLEKDTYECVVKEFSKRELSAVYFEANIVNEQGEKIEERFHYFNNNTILSANEVKNLLLLDEIGSQCWKIVFSKECWLEERFPVGRIYEDIAVIFKVFDGEKKPVLFLNDKFYNYRMNPTGISLGEQNIKKSYNLFLAFYEHYIYSKVYAKNLEEACFIKAVNFAIGAYNIILREINYSAIGPRNEIFKFFKSNYNKILYTVGLRIKYKVMISIIIYLPSLYQKLIFMRKDKNNGKTRNKN